MGFAKSTPNEIPDCAVPLLFETDVEEAPYGHAGTGFLAALDNEVFLVTAGHCIEKDQHNSLVLAVSNSTSEVARLRTFFSQIITPEDSEPMDLSFFSIDSSDKNISILRNRASHLPLTIEFEAIVKKAMRVKTKVPVLARGFPLQGTATRLDFENKRFEPQGVTVLAEYEDTWESDPYSHGIRLREPCPISDLNGMSGSPVFGFTKYEGELTYFLVGMLYLGVFPIAHLLSVRKIRDALRAGSKKEHSEG